jgi:probable phosphoglycerate mutase
MGTIKQTETEDITPAPSTGTEHPEVQSAAARPGRLLLLVRHGQSTYNVEGRLPGQLPGIPLTDEGRRQAQRAAVALSGLPLGAVVTSPLERARETADIIARGWALPTRVDSRLMDIDVGAWSGEKLDDLNKTDPRWKSFAEHPNQAPDGVESFPEVQARAVASVEDIRQDTALGSYVVLVAHADVVKLILAHYTGLETERARFLAVGNASISALAFPPEGEPHLLALNWNALPEWLSPPPAAASAAATQPRPPAETTETPAPRVLESEVADV